MVVTSSSVLHQREERERQEALRAFGLENNQNEDEDEDEE